MVDLREVFRPHRLYHRSAYFDTVLRRFVAYFYKCMRISYVYTTSEPLSYVSALVRDGGGGAGRSENVIMVSGVLLLKTLSSFCDLHKKHLRFQCSRFDDLPRKRSCVLLRLWWVNPPDRCDTRSIARYCCGAQVRMFLMMIARCFFIDYYMLLNL